MVQQGVKIMLKDWEEGGFVDEDKNSDVGMARGEVGLLNPKL